MKLSPCILKTLVMYSVLVVCAALLYHELSTITVFAFLSRVLLSVFKLFVFLLLDFCCFSSHLLIFWVRVVADDDPCIEWASPKTEMLVDYLTYQQHWEPSYIRQRMLPMLSTIYLRDMASSPTNDLLYGHYEFHSIQRVKIRLGLQFYVVKWKKAVNALSDAMSAIPEEPDILQGSEEPDESNDLLEEPDVPVVCINDGCCFLSTDEDMELVRNAFPEKVDQFLKEKVSNSLSLSLSHKRKGKQDFCYSHNNCVKWATRN